MLELMLMSTTHNCTHGNFAKRTERRKLFVWRRETSGFEMVLLRGGSDRGRRRSKALVRRSVRGGKRSAISRLEAVVGARSNGERRKVGGRRGSRGRGNTLGVLMRGRSGRSSAVCSGRQKTKSNLVLFLNLLTLTKSLQDKFHSLCIRDESHRMSVARNSLLLTKIGQNILVRTDELDPSGFHTAIHVIGLLTKKASHLNTNEVA